MLKRFVTNVELRRTSVRHASTEMYADHQQTKHRAALSKKVEGNKRVFQISKLVLLYILTNQAHLLLGLQ